MLHFFNSKRNSRTTVKESAGLTPDELLDKVLEGDQAASVAVDRVAEKEFAYENAFFLQALSALHAVKDDRARVEKLESIRDTFIKVGSEYEINISQKARKEILSQIPETGNITVTDTKALFNEAKNDVRKMLGDALRRHTSLTESVLASLQGKQQFISLISEKLDAFKEYAFNQAKNHVREKQEIATALDDTVKDMTKNLLASSDVPTFEMMLKKTSEKLSPGAKMFFEEATRGRKSSKNLKNALKEFSQQFSTIQPVTKPRARL